MDTQEMTAVVVRCVAKSTARTEACASNLWPYCFFHSFHSAHGLFPFSYVNRHVGDANVECVCPYGYRGNKCETHEFLDDENGERIVLTSGKTIPWNEIFLLSSRM